jgi:uncharacterized membrane protein YqjE
MPIAEKERPLKDVVQGIIGNVQDIIRSEVRLAKAELADQAAKARSALTVMGAGALAGIYSVALLLVTCVLALATTMPAWMAALIVSVVTGIGAAILTSIGLKRFRAVHPTPERAIHSVKENVRWAKEQIR